MKHEHISGPLGNFIASKSRGSFPIPLKSAGYEIEVRSGLAEVRMIRTFRNDEDRPIEATLTFPVPFHAVVTRLEAKVDDRRLVGETKAKAVARESYEDAIDRGKPAVLHEELLRGLHMLSLANVAPGKEVEVTATFVMPVTLSDGNGEFRIPTTVGHVYGEAPFVDSDAPVVVGPVLKARVAVVASKGIAHVNGKSASAAVTARLDRPVDVRVVGLYEEKPEPVFGRAADGRKVSISFSPETARDVALDADLLLDVSGSMKMDYDSDGEVGTKWDAVIAGFLSASEKSFRKDDKVTVWSFSGSCRKHGTMSGDEVGKFVKDMPFDSGGTELQAAVSTVTLSRPETNVLLLTDGKSWNKIDVQQAVSTGARFTVILVGESSLETSVGYLAAMTGGQMFVVGSAGVHSAIVAAVASMRNVSSPVVPVNGKPETVSRRIAGTMIEAKWSDESAEAPAEASLSSAAAFAADLAIQGMKEEEAAQFAEAEGIVSHLTSIVLIDDEAEAVEGVPATRKVPLATPATEEAVFRSAALSQQVSYHASRADAGSRSFLSAAMPVRHFLIQEAVPPVFGGPNDWSIEDAAKELRRLRWRDVQTVLKLIDWDANPDALMKGDVSELPLEVSFPILRLSEVDEVAELARALNVTEDMAVILILADLYSAVSRTAERIARKGLAKADKMVLAKAKKALTA